MVYLFVGSGIGTITSSGTISGSEEYGVTSASRKKDARPELMTEKKEKDWEVINLFFLDVKYIDI